jgi:heat shock protein 4
MKLAYLPEEVPFMKNHYIRSYNIILPKISTEKFELILHFVIDQNGIPSIDKANLNEIWFEEVPVEKKEEKKEDKKDDKKEENKMEVDPDTKQVKKEKSIPVSLSLVEQNFGLSRSTVDQIIQREKKQEKDDQDLILVQRKRNEIEQFIYSTRQKLDEELKDFVTKEEKPVLIKLMEEIENWFYSDDPEIENMTILSNKSKALEDLGRTIYTRFNEWNNVSEAVGYFIQQINQVESRANADFDKFNKKDPLCYLKDKDFEEIKSAVSLYKQKLQDSQVILSNSVKIDIPQVNDKTIKQYIEDFNRKINSIYSSAENKWREEKKKEEDRIKKEKEEKEKAEKEAKEAKGKEENKEVKTDNKDLNMDVD